MTAPLPPHDQLPHGGPAAPDRSRSRGPAVRAAALLLAGGLLGGVVALTATRHHDSGVTATGVPLAGPAPIPAALAQAPAPGGPAPQVPTALPVSIDIAKIHVKSPLIDLHLDLNQTLQVPQDYGVAGWYSDGPLPGDAGAPAVIVGHVDSKNGPGIFYNLAALTTGDPVLITRADGTQLRFQVYAATDYPKDTFPAEQVYGATTQPELRLITCTGTFDRSTGHYLSNRVVYAQQTPPTAPAG